MLQDNKHKHLQVKNIILLLGTKVNLYRGVETRPLQIYIAA